MRLIIIVALVIPGFVAISRVFFQPTRKACPGLAPWTAEVGFLTLGYLALTLRALIPDALFVFAGNVGFTLSTV
jgi:hypothetical protein